MAPPLTAPLVVALLVALILLVMLAIAKPPTAAKNENFLIYPYLNLTDGENDYRGSYYALSECNDRPWVDPRAGEPTKRNTPWAWNAWRVKPPTVPEKFCGSCQSSGSNLTGPNNTQLYNVPLKYPVVMGKDATDWSLDQKCVAYCSQGSSQGVSPSGPADAPENGDGTGCVVWCR